MLITKIENIILKIQLSWYHQCILPLSLWICSRSGWKVEKIYNKFHLFCNFITNKARNIFKNYRVLLKKKKNHSTSLRCLSLRNETKRNEELVINTFYPLFACNEKYHEITIECVPGFWVTRVNPVSRFLKMKRTFSVQPLTYIPFHLLPFREYSRVRKKKKTSNADKKITYRLQFHETRAARPAGNVTCIVTRGRSFLFSVSRVHSVVQRIMSKVEPRRFVNA